MGVFTRMKMCRVLAVLGLFGSICLTGCSSDVTPTNKQGFDIQPNDSVRPASATQDTEKVPVEKPKPQLPKQLFNLLDRNGDGVIDEDELSLAKSSNLVVGSDKKVVEALWQNRAAIGHVVAARITEVPATVSTGDAGIRFTANLRYRSEKYVVNQQEFERFLAGSSKPQPPSEEHPGDSLDS